MKKLIFILFVLINCNLFSQKKQIYKFGSISQSEHELQRYEKDTTANAIFLFEYGSTKFKQSNSAVIISTKYYAKVKIFKKEGFENATIKIPIYNNSNASEKVIDIKAITHNGMIKTSLSKKNIFTEKINEYWSEVKFTMPNLKENSIIEYEYTFETPFKFNFKGWEFQTNIPKIHSEFYALIPGNFIYNRRLNGFHKLSKNESKIKKSCFRITGISAEADCEEVFYTMDDIPSFIEEDFMTSKDNFLSAIKFELSEFRGFDGSNYKYTKTWQSVDKEFKTDKSIGRQLRKVDYLEKQLSEDLMLGANDIIKAKKVYAFIQNHFTWNNKTRLFSEVNVKEAFKNKIGNSTEINIALINALNAVGFEANIVLLSTRDNGVPTKLYPIMSDFNYAIAQLTIGDQSFLLDATDKLLPFGMLPFKTLNHYGRVMDFKKGSYWTDIKAKNNTRTLVSMDLEIDENGNFIGVIKKSFSGYNAYDQREKINAISEENYLNEIENDDRLIINSYENFNVTQLDKTLTEVYNVILESNLSQNLVILNPFILTKISKNPFKLNQRSYPIDFGYPRTFQYVLKLNIPEHYKIKSLPENKAFKLPNNGGNYIFSIDQKENEIKVLYKFSIIRSYFIPEEYPYLKEFYKQIIKTQNSLITLEKIK